MGLNVAFWPTVVGVAILVVGLVVARDRFSAAEGLDKLIVLGPALVAGSIASFGGEHLVIAKDMVGMVPKYMPWQLFWVYFVGVALLAAALSLAAGKCVRWSAPWLAVMIGLFVLMLSVPAVVAHPGNRLSWTLMLRDSCFSLGALAMTASVWGAGATNPGKVVPLKPKEGLNGGPISLNGAFISVLGRWVIQVARVVIGGTLIFYGVQYLMHPEAAGGIPLEKMTPAWVPGLRLWDYLGGLILVAGGWALVANFRARSAATWVSFWMVVVTVFLYLPIFVLDPSGLKMEGMNYVFDTLFFGGTMLFLATALPGASKTAKGTLVAFDEVRAGSGVPVL